MQRSEMVGLGVAVLGHAALFALLTLSFCAPPRVEPPHAKPIDVSLVDDVGLVATAPQSTEAPAESQAPDKGPPEDAAAAAKQEAEPDPTPPAPQPEAAPPPIRLNHRRVGPMLANASTNGLPTSANSGLLRFHARRSRTPTTSQYGLVPPVLPA